MNVMQLKIALLGEEIRALATLMQARHLPIGKIMEYEQRMVHLLEEVKRIRKQVEELAGKL